MSTLKNVLSRIGSRPSRRVPAARRFVPALLALEDRNVPAGVVNANFVAGVLTLTAVNDPTDVNITNTNHQNITLVGFGTNDIEVLANNTETGTAFGTTFKGVTSIRLAMGLGNDTVTLTNMNLPGMVTFQGGSGNNTLNIDGANNFTGLVGLNPGNVTLRGVSVTNGDGNDQFHIGGGKHTINGNVTINNGVGGSFTRFGVALGNETSVTGAVRITNLAGQDSLVAAGTLATFGGAVTVNNGHGGSNAQFIATSNKLLGGLTLTNGGSDDNFMTGGNEFIVGTPEARRNLTISNGTGYIFTEQKWTATNHTINGNITVTGTAGRDNFTVDGENFTVLGDVRISTGNGVGNNPNITSITPNAKVDIDGVVAVTAGEGLDALEFGAPIVDVGSVNFSSGNGPSQLSFSGGALTVARGITHSNLAGGAFTLFGAVTHEIGGVITSTHGDGWDFFHVIGNNFTSGAISIRNGAGGSQSHFEAATSNTINGNVTITNGDGFDSFNAQGAAFTLGSAVARRNLTITNGHGDSETKLSATTTTINGNIAVTSQEGRDIFDVSGAIFDVTGPGNVTINQGIGSSSTWIDAGENSIGGRLSVSATDGDDTVSLRQLTMGGATSLNTGQGNDFVQVDDSTFNGAFVFAAGGGADTVNIEVASWDTNIDTVFNAAATINTGEGDDFVWIGRATAGADIADFKAAVSLNGGLDLDIIDKSLGTTFAVAPLITAFEQDHAT